MDQRPDDRPLTNTGHPRFYYATSRSYSLIVRIHTDPLSALMGGLSICRLVVHVLQRIQTHTHMCIYICICTRLYIFNKLDVIYIYIYDVHDINNNIIHDAVFVYLYIYNIYIDILITGEVKCSERFSLLLGRLN